jgi:glucose/arabinose dehydrogenase/mono/diheme cytochrome c family protein
VRALLAGAASVWIGSLSLSALTAQTQSWRADAPGSDFTKKPPIKPLSPEEEAKTFILPPGYHMELVLADPDISEPAALAFDGNGRLFVVEMRSYMLDADARDESDPISRISMHESTKGDGKYDRHSVFIDKLVVPRMVTPMDNHSVLTMETDTDDIYQYWDTNGDGVADKKKLFFSGAGRKGNLEHQPSGFIWGLDNWIYSTYNAFRIRWSPTGVRTGPTASNGGQWGLTQDDDGKVWFVDAGGERGPVNFQTPIQYGAFNVGDQFEPDFETTWPTGPGLSDMQGGMLRVRMPIGGLNHFTATCGQNIYRGDKLPADLRGDLLFAEPVGRLVRRSKVVVTEGLTQLQNAYPRSEFILSTDPLFRPVDIQTAPDGTIYIADMYHGIIQESEWTKPGTYLRKKIEQYQLDKVTGHGRIWRLVYDGMTPDATRPRMLDETPAQLVAHLDHPNGWWRDSAQKLLVLKQDKSVVPALQTMARAGSNVLGRIHALWTLEGLDALDAGLVREEMKDPIPQIRVQALRASESLVKAGDKTLDPDIRALTKDPDTKVAIQAMLTLSLLKAPDLAAIVKTTQETNKTRGVQEIGDQLIRPRTTGFGGGFRFLTAEQQGTMQKGAGIYAELCYSCHGTDGKGAPMGGAPAGTMMAPPLAGSSRVLGHRDYTIKALLHGLSGPIAGNTYPGVMVPMGANDDAWVAAAGSYVRNNWGNSAPFITPSQVAAVRAATAKRDTFWTVDELQASVPVQLAPEPGWKVTASHNPDVAARALGDAPAARGNGAAGGGAAGGSQPGTGQPVPIAGPGAPGSWNSGAPQQPGMWFQVELSEPVLLTELQFESVVGRQPQLPPMTMSGGRPPQAPSASGQSNGGAAAGGATPTGAPSGATPGAGAQAGAAQAAPSAAAGGARAAAPAPAGDGPPAALVNAIMASIGFPRGYKVEVSMDGSAWGTPVAEGQGTGPSTIIMFPATRAKFLRITQTATTENAPNWSIQRLRLYQPGIALGSH